MMPLRILDKDINLIGEIDGYEDFVLKRRFFSLSDFEFKIDANKKHVDKLVKNNLVVLGKCYDKVGIILHRNFTGDDKTGKLLIKGVTLQGLINRRLIIPEVGESYQSISGKQETIIKYFVDKNCVNTTNVKRKIPNLIIAEDKLRGVDDGWRSSYENLSDKLKEICEYCELGWNVVLNKDTKSFVFDVIEGKDKTVNQRENPPVIFRSDFKNIASRNYLESIINCKNVVYTGTSEDSNKIVLSVGDVDGFDRIETFVSFNSDDVEEILKEGTVQLKELEELKSFEINVNPNSTFIYEKDYNLGDIVTVQDRKLKLTMDIRIVEIEESHSKNGVKIKVTFGSSIPNVLTKINKIERKVR